MAMEHWHRVPKLRNCHLKPLFNIGYIPYDHSPRSPGDAKHYDDDS